MPDKIIVRPGGPLHSGPAYPVAGFLATSNGLTATFTDQSYGRVGGVIASWQWNFGDGSPVSFEPSPVHVYAAPGPKTVTLTVTDSTGLADVAGLQVTIAANPAGPLGIPFGPFSLWSSSTVFESVGTASFNLSLNSDSAGGIIARINAARAAGQKLCLAMTGGSHAQNYQDGANPPFHLPTWKLRMDAYNTAPIKAAVAAGVVDHTVLGNSVMDEPNHSSWGGVMTKPLIDQMCAYVKGIFPTLPVGVVVTHDWRPTEHYTVADFVVDQYSIYSDGSNLTAFRDAGLAMGVLDGVLIVFSLNVLDGGSVIAGCPVPQTGGPGTFGGHCRVTAAQLQSLGITLGRASPGGLFIWRYDQPMFQQPSYQGACAAVKADLATRASQPSWLRP